ncbi:rCG21887 [Rattus norvegicus]|uniref:RCG21887 n=1 Tax=Rattus norvegicus TaxID=10116 RepID=A6J2D1_RAT|nr:rCG21887 [Rattus norvegicus]
MSIMSVCVLIKPEKQMQPVCLSSAYNFC